jgi:flagellum-specific peptidoglycan hydrolase FlgJ
MYKYLVIIALFFGSMAANAQEQTVVGYNGRLKVTFPRKTTILDHETIFKISSSVEQIDRVRVLIEDRGLGSARMENGYGELAFTFSGVGKNRPLTFACININNDTIARFYGVITTERPKGGKITTKPSPPNLNDYPKPPVIEQPKVVPVPKTGNVPFLQVTNAKNQQLRFLTTPLENEQKGLNDNVYLAATGHPTVAEEMSFILDIKDEAIRIAHQHKLPASAIMGIAILESGAGYTRTAVYANNIFGLKIWNGASAANAWQLKGQPDEDEGRVKIIKRLPTKQFIFEERNRRDNWYQVFASWNESIDFFVNEVILFQTGKWPRDYRQVADKYQANINAGLSKKEASLQFLYEIAENGYTSKGPSFYLEKIGPLMEKYNLYQYD